jgi:hypothetical protein
MFADTFDAAWWKEQTVIWLVFSALAGLVSLAVQLLLRRCERRKYEGWKLETVGFDDPPQALYWEDVRKWLASPRDLWVMVKGTVSGVCNLTLRTIDAARESGWVQIEEAGRRIVVDITRIPPAHLEGGKFKVGHHPPRWVYAAPPGALAPAAPPTAAAGP